MFIVLIIMLAGSYTINILTFPYLLQSIEMLKARLFKKVFAVAILQTLIKIFYLLNRPIQERTSLLRIQLAPSFFLQPLIVFAVDEHLHLFFRKGRRSNQGHFLFLQAVATNLPYIHQYPDLASLQIKLDYNTQMKSISKAQFSTKLAAVLTKFKDSSTVQVAHDQARALFGEFALKDIFVAFISKVDTTEQMSEREKKEMAKLYTTFVDAYKAQLLAEQYYQKLLESLSKKAVGVSDVLSHICKTLLSRIQDYDLLLPYVSTILSTFHSHSEIARVLKQISETVSPSVVAALQGEIMGVISERLGSSKAKGDFLDAVLSLVLCLEERLEVEQQVVGILMKHLRNEEWSCRKNCVDITYALLVINQRVPEQLHSIIRQLKYDKIKHVRDSVNNYDKLHQQIYGKETPKKQPPQPSIREAKIKSDYSYKKIARSPVPVAKEPQEKERQAERDRPNSLDKSTKMKKKNENFFKNAKNSDVIRVTQSTTPQPQRQQQPDDDAPSFTQSLYMPKEQPSANKNFEAYLKDRASPRQKNVLPVFQKPTLQRQSEMKKVLTKFQSEKEEQKKKFNYESELEHFRKKQKVGEVQITAEKSRLRVQQKESRSFAQDPADRSQPQFSLSFISNKQEKGVLQDFRVLMLGFQKRINERLDKLQIRIENLERNNSGSVNSSGLLEKDHTFDVLGVSQLQQSPRSVLYNSTPFDSKYSYTDRQGVQSNLQEKIRMSIANQNWDEAFTIALTNNRKNVLLNLLERCVFPLDRTVQECILLEVRKLLSYVSALKWLRHYLAERQPPHDRLLKLREDLRRRPQTDNRNYQMLRQMLLNDIHQKLGSNQN